MSERTEVRQWRKRLQNEEWLTDVEREEAGQLLNRAEQGDAAALEQLRQFAAERAHRGFSPIPGTGPAIPPGRLLVCPVDPAHFSDFDRGVEETCPVHGVALVPKE